MLLLGSFHYETDQESPKRNKEPTQQDCSKAAERAIFPKETESTLQSLLQFRKSLKITGLKRTEILWSCSARTQWAKGNCLELPFIYVCLICFKSHHIIKWRSKKICPYIWNFFFVICSMITLRENVGSSTQTFGYLRLLSHQPLGEVFPSWWASGTRYFCHSIVLTWLLSFWTRNNLHVLNYAYKWNNCNCCSFSM